MQDIKTSIRLMFCWMSRGLWYLRAVCHSTFQKGKWKKSVENTQMEKGNSSWCPEYSCFSVPLVSICLHRHQDLDTGHLMVTLFPDLWKAIRYTYWDITMVTESIQNYSGGWALISLFKKIFGACFKMYMFEEWYLRMIYNEMWHCHFCLWQINHFSWGLRV